MKLNYMNAVIGFVFGFVLTFIPPVANQLAVMGLGTPLLYGSTGQVLLSLGGAALLGTREKNIV